MSIWYTKCALLEDRWHNFVDIEVNEREAIIRLTPDATQVTAQSLHGSIIPAKSNLHFYAFQRLLTDLADIVTHLEDSFRSCRDMIHRKVAQLSTHALLRHRATTGGAQACGLLMGKLAVEYRADWLVLEENSLLAGIPDLRSSIAGYLPGIASKSAMCGFPANN